MIDPLVLRAFSQHMEKSSSVAGKVLGATIHAAGNATGFVAAHPGVAALPLAAGGIYAGGKAIKAGTKAISQESGTIAPLRMRRLASPVV